jgi:S1-C subfamily serine protease
MKLGSTSTMKPGERVIAVGSPKGFDRTASDGLYNGLRDMNEQGKLMQFSAAISHGSSGGPVLDERAEVIAIVTWMEGGQNLNFGVPVEDVKRLPIVATTN